MAIKQIEDRKKEINVPEYNSFTPPPPLRNLLIAQRSQPQTLADNMRFDFEAVLRASFEETEQALDDSSGSMVAVEVNQTLAVDRGRIDEGGFLGVVD